VIITLNLNVKEVPSNDNQAITPLFPHVRKGPADVRAAFDECRRLNKIMVELLDQVAAINERIVEIRNQAVSDALVAS
jgi:hypothetical protein